jgi:phenylalanyl-tRNA synthetase beta chain
MKISLNWLRDYVDLPKDTEPKRLAERLTMTTVEVEQVSDIARPLENIVVGRIDAVSPHPVSPTLHVCDVDYGRGTTRVVCGAANVAAGAKVALALEGAIVRDAQGAEQTMRAVDVRGVASNGMLCAPSELGLGHAFSTGAKNILDLSALDAAPGTPLAEAIGYDDVMLEIDNKSLTNRPDLWGHHGIARELAAMFDLPLSEPPTYGALPGASGFEARIEAPDLCARYTATRVTGVAATPSPTWMQARLAKVGQRPMNLLVDLTNYVMFATGQPLHVFDARDVRSRIVVRRARPGESLVLLDDSNIELDADTLVIAEDESPVALAGIMGGHLGVREDTTAIFLEAANFDPIPIRRTARRFGLRTESSTRFEKGIDIQRVDLAVQMFLALLTELQPESRIVEHVDTVSRRPAPVTIDVGVKFLQRKLGLELSADEIRALLRRLQFGCTIDGDTLHVEVPSWRSTGDVSLPEDIVEEVARLYGYDNFAFTPPVVKLEKAVIQPRLRTQRRVREYFAFRAGMREVVSYPWMTAQALDAAGMSQVPTLGLATPPAAGVRLAPSLIPHMLENVSANLRHLTQFRIFELTRVFRPRLAESAEGEETLPEQPHSLAAALVGSDAATLFFEAKGILEMLDRTVQVAPLSFSEDVDVPWGDPAARLAIRSDGKTIGALAVASARAKRLAGIRRAEVVMLELNVDALTPLPSRNNRPEPLPTYPQVDFDISMVIGVGVKWAEARAVALAADEMVRAVTFVDHYVGPQVPAGSKSLTIRLQIGSDRGTLVREQIDEIARKVMAELRSRLQAVIREE